MAQQQIQDHQIKNIVSRITSECIFSYQNIQDLNNVMQNIYQENYQKQICVEPQFYYINHNKESLLLQLDFVDTNFRVIYSSLYNIYEILSKNQSNFKKLIKAFGFYDQQTKSILNDKYVPTQKYFYFFDKYLIKQYLQYQYSQIDKEFIYDLDSLKENNIPYVKVLRIKAANKIEQAMKVILKCSNLIEIIFYFFSELENSEKNICRFLLESNKQIPNVKIYLTVFNKNNNSDIFNKIDDQTLSHLNIYKLNYYFVFSQDPELIQREINQIQKISNLTDFHLQFYINGIKEQIGKCIAKFVNLKKLRLRFQLGEGIILIEAINFFKEISNLQSLLILELTFFFELDSFLILSALGQCQNLIQLVLIFKRSIQQFQPQQLAKEIKKLKNLNSLIILQSFFEGNKNFQFERQIISQNIKLITFINVNSPSELIQKLHSKGISQYYCKRIIWGNQDCEGMKMD